MRLNHPLSVAQCPKDDEPLFASGINGADPPESARTGPPEHGEASTSRVSEAAMKEQNATAQLRCTPKDSRTKPPELGVQTSSSAVATLPPTSKDARTKPPELGVGSSSSALQRPSASEGA